MERSGKRVQKNRDENRDGENSNSTSSALSPSSQGHKTNEATDKNNSNKNEGRNTSKKIKRKRGESLNSPGQFQAEPDIATTIEDAPINNLPPEMLSEIFKFVDTSSLLKCRLVSCRWRGISTAIFRNRVPANPIFFHYHGGTFRQQGERTLKEFLQCAKNSTSENCPFTYFCFSIEDSTCFEDKNFREFISLFSTRRLKHFYLQYFNRTAEFPVFVEKLRHFLLNDVPQLEELRLELALFCQDECDYKQFPLFPINTNEFGSSLPVPIQFELPNLKLLHLDPPTISSHPQICKDLLNAAVNLTRIKTTVMRPKHFEFFHSLGKFHLLKDLDLYFNGNFVEDMENDEFKLQFKNWSQSENFFSLVHLDKLELMDDIDVSEFDKASLIQASKLVSALLESSKDSLRDLKIGEFPFLAHLQLPVFTRLRTLKIHASKGHQIFPNETRTRNILPVVDFLQLYVENWTVSFPQPYSIPGLTGVKTLIINEWNFKAEQAEIAVSVLAQLCPNLKKFKIQMTKDMGPPKLNFVEVGRSIWTLMKELECLEVDVDLDNPENNPVALDSCFSGVLQDTCLHLLKLTQSKQFLEENGISVEEIPESKLKAEREHPSILNMKNLRNLTVNPYSGKMLLDKTEFSNKLTWISHEFGFKLMPNLKLNEGHF